MFIEQPNSVRGPGINDAVSMDITVTANVALAVGEVVALNAPSFTGAGLSAVGWVPESMSCAKAVLGNCEAASRKICGVALEPAAAGSKVRIRLRGVCQALMKSNMTDVTYGGGGLTADSGSLTNTAAGAPGQADTQISIAIPLEATGTAAVLKFVMFDGIYGFGGIPEA
jgi:hypothetical protein